VATTMTPAYSAHGEEDCEGKSKVENIADMLLFTHCQKHVSAVLFAFRVFVAAAQWTSTIDKGHFVS
jgi:hypothetical protein